LGFNLVQRGGDKLKRIQSMSIMNTARAQDMTQHEMTQDERREVRREALMRALAIVQRYQDENWRRLRVNDICADLKRLIKIESER
jgi:hypothetical protein